jgi:hypothetical protein
VTSSLVAAVRVRGRAPSLWLSLHSELCSEKGGGEGD